MEEDMLNQMGVVDRHQSLVCTAKCYMIDGVEWVIIAESHRRTYIVSKTPKDGEYMDNNVEESMGKNGRTGSCMEAASGVGDLASRTDEDRDSGRAAEASYFWYPQD